MNYDIFTDDKDRQEAIDVMPQLENHAAWKFITRSLEANIQKLTDELKDDEFDDLLEVRLKQKQITHLSGLLQLPQTILQAAAPEPETEEEAIYD